MVGSAVRGVLSARGIPFEAPSRADLDVTDAVAVGKAVERFAEGGGRVLNLAAYTDVERAEDEAEAAFLVNAEAPGRLAEACAANGLPLAHVSTDFVFDGRKGAPYAETDDPNPLSVYGRSKLAGERAIAEQAADALIVRTAWVYGEGAASFPLKVLERAGAQGGLRVVDDERGNPTYAGDLAEGIVRLILRGASGTCHLTGAGACTRYELAREVLAVAGLDVPVTPVSSAEFPSKAARPADSRLDCSRAAGLAVRLPWWRDGLTRFLSARGVPVR